MESNDSFHSSWGRFGFTRR